MTPERDELAYIIVIFIWLSVTHFGAGFALGLWYAGCGG
jgi:hypothetical protein